MQDRVQSLIKMLKTGFLAYGHFHSRARKELADLAMAQGRVEEVPWEHHDQQAQGERRAPSLMAGFMEEEAIYQTEC